MIYTSTFNIIFYTSVFHHGSTSPLVFYHSIPVFLLSRQFVSPYFFLLPFSLDLPLYGFLDTNMSPQVLLSWDARMAQTLHVWLPSALFWFYSYLFLSSDVLQSYCVRMDLGSCPSLKVDLTHLSLSLSLSISLSCSLFFSLTIYLFHSLIPFSPFFLSLLSIYVSFSLLLCISLLHFLSTCSH